MTSLSCRLSFIQRLPKLIVRPQEGRTNSLDAVDDAKTALAEAICVGWRRTSVHAARRSVLYIAEMFTLMMSQSDFTELFLRVSRESLDLLTNGTLRGLFDPWKIPEIVPQCSTRVHQEFAREGNLVQWIAEFLIACEL